MSQGPGLTRDGALPQERLTGPALTGWVPVLPPSPTALRPQSLPPFIAEMKGDPENINNYIHRKRQEFLIQVGAAAPAGDAAGPSARSVTRALVAAVLPGREAERDAAAGDAGGRGGGGAAAGREGPGEGGLSVRPVPQGQ